MAVQKRQKLDHKPLVEAMERYIVRKLTPEEREALKLAASDFIAENEGAILSNYGSEVMESLRKQHRQALDAVLDELSDRGCEVLSARERVDIIQDVVHSVLHEWKSREYAAKKAKQDSIPVQIEKMFAFKDWDGAWWMPVIGTLLYSIAIGTLLCGLALGLSSIVR